MNATQRIEEGLSVAQKLKDARLRLAEAEGHHRSALLVGLMESDGKTAEVRKAQAAEFASPLQKQIDEIKAEIEYLVAHKNLIESTPADAAA